MKDMKKLVMVMAVVLLGAFASPEVQPMSAGVRIEITCGRRTAASASGTYSGVPWSVSCTAGNFADTFVNPISSTHYDFSITEGSTSCPFSGDGAGFFGCAHTALAITATTF